MCQRAFGKNVKIKSIQELSGGTFNETYLIKFPGKAKTILRVAPIPSPDLFWDDVALMRREHAMFPFFAAMAPLMPKILLTDFTHQLIGRDYMFQTVIEGERWSDIEDDLTPEANLALWQQCGTMVKEIHATTGEWFGYAYPGFHNKWSDVVLERFSRISQSMRVHQIDIPAFEGILNVAKNHVPLLDEVVVPRLLHGDLWTFNLLISQGESGPTITGVLDTDRAWWGDPMADWIMFLLAIRRNDPAWQSRIAAFYNGYGEVENSETAQFRQEIYKAMHTGLAALWGARHESEEDVARANAEIREIASTFKSFR